MAKIKRAFIRGLWGIYDHKGRRYYMRRVKLDNDMKMIKLNKNAQKHTESAKQYGLDVTSLKKKLKNIPKKSKSS